MQALEKYNPQFELLGRIFLAAIFLRGGIFKILGYAGFGGYMESFGIPTLLLPLVILTELGCGLALLVGLKTRLAAFLLAGFTLLTIILIHNPLNDPGQWNDAMKNLAIAGGMLILMTRGAGPLSMEASAEGD